MKTHAKTSPKSKKSLLTESPPTSRWDWPTMGGAFLMILGVTVVGFPQLSNVTMVGGAWLIGLALLVSGVVQMLHAYVAPQSYGASSLFMLAAVSIVGGIVSISSPEVGMVAVTIVLSFYLLLGGAARGLLAFESPRLNGRGFLIFSSVAAMSLGIYLLSKFPGTSTYIPANVLGVDLLFYGAAMIFIARGIRMSALGDTRTSTAVRAI